MLSLLKMGQYQSGTRRSGTVVFFYLKHFVIVALDQ